MVHRMAPLEEQVLKFYALGMNKTTVFSLGGSIIAPAEVDTEFLSAFIKLIKDRVINGRERFIIVTGGGRPARTYQSAYRDITDKPDAAAQDWLGIMATRLNAQLLKALFAEYCTDDVVYDPTAEFGFSGNILLAAGWKPGFSSDYDAVLLAERFGADTLINLSNIPRVYSADPRTNPDARPYDSLSWAEMRTLVGDLWEPGKNTPFDPVAVKKAAHLHLKVIIAAGRDIQNLEAILTGRSFRGTVIGPE